MTGSDKDHNVQSESQAAAWTAELAGAPPERILAWAAARFAGRLAFATSLGAEDQALTDLIARHAPAIPLFTLDTGRLFPETCELLAATERRYGLRVRIYFPDSGAVERLVSEHGIEEEKAMPILLDALCDQGIVMDYQIRARARKRIMKNGHDNISRKRSILTTPRAWGIVQRSPGPQGPQGQKGPKEPCLCAFHCWLTAFCCWGRR